MPEGGGARNPEGDAREGDVQREWEAGGLDRKRQERKERERGGGNVQLGIREAGGRQEMGIAREKGKEERKREQEAAGT